MLALRGVLDEDSLGVAIERTGRYSHWIYAATAMEGFDLIGSKKTYCLRTYSESADSGDTTDFDSESSLELFRQWMNYVHQVAYDNELSESELKEALGLDINSHREVYALYKNRNKLVEFFKAMASYEGTLRRNIRLERDRIDTLRDLEEIIV